MIELIYKKIEDVIRPFVEDLDYFFTYRIWKPLLNKDINNGSIRKILVMENAMLGDLINATPAFATLKENFPNAKIAVVCLEKTEALLKHSKHVDHVVPIRKEARLRRWNEFLNLKRKIAQERFDLAVILHHGTFATSLLTLLAGISYRIGCTRTGILNGKGFFLTKKRAPSSETKHIIEQDMDVLRLLPIKISNNHAIHLEVTKKEENDIRKKFNLVHGIKYIGIHMETFHKIKRWDKDRWAEIINVLSKHKNSRIVITGTYAGLKDIERVLEKVDDRKRIIIAAGKTSLRETMALVKQLNLLISVDTSIVHIAAAFEIPTVVLYGPGYPEKWHPWNKNARLIFNKKERSMDSITAEQVLDEVRRLA